MPRSFGLVDYKVKEAEYFLLRIKDAEYDFFGVQFDAVAFTAAARSITFAMQSSLKGVEKFDEWYELKQAEMKSDPLAKFFNDFRRVSQHIGENAVVGARTDQSGTVFLFGASPELKVVPEMDVASACEQYYKSVLEIVYECYLEFATLINGQWKFTQEHFSSIGLTIEDAEEELGLPRGWSGVSGLEEQVRWKYLRMEADGCQIQQQFEGWLGKRAPHPDDEI